MTVVWRYARSIEDVEALRLLRNAGREWFGDPREISSGDQIAWWEANKENVRCVLVGEPPIGYGMISHREGRLWISLGVDRVARGQGWGRKIYELIGQLVSSDETPIFAAIRADNIASIRAATHAGYSHVEDVPPPGVALEDQRNWIVFRYPND